jgi:hypothetical protein
VEPWMVVLFVAIVVGVIYEVVVEFLLPGDEEEEDGSDDGDEDDLDDEDDDSGPIADALAALMVGGLIGGFVAVVGLGVAIGAVGWDGEHWPALEDASTSLAEVEERASRRLERVVVCGETDEGRRYVCSDGVGRGWIVGDDPGGADGMQPWLVVLLVGIAIGAVNEFRHDLLRDEDPDDDDEEREGFFKRMTSALMGGVALGGFAGALALVFAVFMFEWDGNHWPVVEDPPTPLAEVQERASRTLERDVVCGEAEGDRRYVCSDWDGRGWFVHDDGNRVRIERDAP